MNPAPVREMCFSHGDEAAAAIHGVDVQFSVLSPSTRSWRLVEARVCDSILVSGEMGAALCTAGAIEPDVLWFVVPIENAGRWTINEQTFGAHSVACLPEGTEHVSFMSVPVQWMSLQIGRDAFERKARGRNDVFIPEGLSFFRDGESGVAPFRSAMEVAARFVQAQPDALRAPDVQARLENALLDPLMGALAKPRAPQASRSQAAMADIRRYLDGHPHEVLSPADLCAALSISERTLRRYFEEAYDTSPGRFLRLRRLNQARRALRSGAFASVTAAGIRFGFFDLGRFAADYHRLFGEFPSHTLSHANRAGASQ
jgi:AraC-like DNA-binding protein